MINVRYEIDQKTLQDVQRRLGEMRDKAPTVIARALNRTAISARQKLVSGMRSAYTVKSGGAKSDMAISKASPGNLEAEVRSQGSPMHIPKFHHSAPKAGARAGIKQGGLKQINVNGNRAWKGKNGLVWARTGESRLPIKALMSNSVPKMVEMVYTGESGVGEALQPVIEERLKAEMERQIKFLVG